MRQQNTSSDEPLSFSQHEEIDRLCSEFEQQCRNGEHPRIEDCLVRVASSVRAALLQKLIGADVEQRHKVGEQLAIDVYYQRFPDFRAAVEAGWVLTANRALRDPGPASTVNISRDINPETGSDPSEVRHDAPQRIPLAIGRYEIRQVLGEGGCGRVYRAFDPHLQREVAVKVPGRRKLSSATSVATLLQEARAAAQLKHPGLVVVFDVQQEGDDVYIVQEYIDGQDLSQWVRANRPSRECIVSLVKEIVEAVGFAHQNELVHRDLKPANVLMDRYGHPHIADFGLALNESAQRLHKGEICGTPPYMSPEQVRGLTHILDGRSDLWSIGVILYELLTGRRPFGGASHMEVFEEVKHRHPKPPRMINPDISADLERICLKCLAKRQTDRYASAAELLEDLVAYSQQPSPVAASARSDGEQAQDVLCPATPQDLQAAGSNSVPADLKSETRQVLRIVPKGLRSFDEHDSDFFLRLLPGPADRDGLPESIRFWKRRIEEIDAEKTFRVGLIYGPSGCGKSSLVRAGLLPRLASHVVPVYLEATPEDTELRLLKSLRRRFPTIPADLVIPDVLAGIREGMWAPENTKVCVVLDQFEQWLHVQHGVHDSQLLEALRYCDGGRLQCVCLVRDDFWLVASRFMQDLEIRLLEGENCALVDLFDLLHARNVLAAFGRAYGRLPDQDAELSDEQTSFLDQAVEGLAQEGKIICVRLALFADMLKGRPWNAATLSQVGGAEGLGVVFLEETFSSRTAPVAHRFHIRAAQKVLATLLPDSDVAIRGHLRSSDELLGQAGYGSRPREFGELLTILEHNLRLITPVDPEGIDATIEPAIETGVAKKTYYHLSHDYLVPSLRTWLSLNQSVRQKFGSWVGHPSRVREAGVFTATLSVVFCFLHVGIMFAHLVARFTGASGAWVDSVSSPNTVPTMLFFICAFDAPYFILSLRMLKNSLAALWFSVLLDSLVIGFAMLFLFFPDLHPMGSSETVVHRWIIIGFIFAPIIVYHLIAIVAYRSTRSRRAM